MSLWVGWVGSDFFGWLFFLVFFLGGGGCGRRGWVRWCGPQQSRAEQGQTCSNFPQLIMVAKIVGRTTFSNDETGEEMIQVRN